MYRSAVLTAIIATGTVSIAVAAFRQPPQGATPAALNATKIEKVKDNLYVISGSGVANLDTFNGGNTAVFITDRGVVLVDTKLPGWVKPSWIASRPSRTSRHHDHQHAHP